MEIILALAFKSDTRLYMHVLFINLFSQWYMYCLEACIFFHLVSRWYVGSKLVRPFTFDTYGDSVPYPFCFALEP